MTAEQKETWATKGEAVVCINGHPICEISHDIHVGDAPQQSDFVNWQQPIPERDERVGEIRCRLCQGFWVRRKSDRAYEFHFSDGWR